MTAEVLRRAGEPFFTTKEPGSGMGLGLFLARRTIERVSGTFEIESIAKVGTIVHLRLPARGMAMAAAT
jgi:two-component system sensor histidine kinase RegB